jgi:hypothetical protein
MRAPKKQNPYAKTASKKNYLPPWIDELSQRLYDGGFRNEKYYAAKCHFSEKVKHDYFNQIIEESRFASKLLTSK